MVPIITAVMTMLESIVSSLITAPVEDAVEQNSTIMTNSTTNETALN